MEEVFASKNIVTPTFIRVYFLILLNLFYTLYEFYNFKQNYHSTVA